MIKTKLNLRLKAKYEQKICEYLQELKKNGYIVSFTDDVLSGGKKRTYYRITDLGMQFYRAKCEEWDITQEVVAKFIRH